MKRSLQGSVYKSKNGKRWYARLRYTDETGRRREKKKSCLSYELAKAKIVELKNEIGTENRIETFSKLVEFYKAKYVHKAVFDRSGKKISGFKQNLQIINAYLDFAVNHFGDIKLSKINFSSLETYKAKIQTTLTRNNKPRSVADVNQNLRKLRRVLNVAVEQQFIATNPFNHGRGLIPTSHETERIRTLTKDEERLLLDQCTGRRSHLRPIIIFALDTAARKGEILSVKWFDVDFNNRSIRVKNKTTSDLSTRVVPITARLAVELKQLRGTYLNANADVFSFQDFKRSWATALRLAGLNDLHFHDLRHTAITRMLELGISAPLVMKISGHSNYKTFMRYVNHSEQSILRIAERMDAA